MRKKASLVMIVLLVIPLMSSCDLIKAGYENPITGEVNYREDSSSNSISDGNEDKESIVGN